jgi:hypothetical protein
MSLLEEVLGNHLEFSLIPADEWIDENDFQWPEDDDAELWLDSVTAEE